jgi:hypothetical protein
MKLLFRWQNARRYEIFRSNRLAVAPLCKRGHVIYPKTFFFETAGSQCGEEMPKRAVINFAAIFLPLFLFFGIGGCKLVKLGLDGISDLFLLARTMTKILQKQLYAITQLSILEPERLAGSCRQALRSFFNRKIQNFRIQYRALSRIVISAPKQRFELAQIFFPLQGRRGNDLDLPQFKRLGFEIKIDLKFGRLDQPQRSLLALVADQ